MKTLIVALALVPVFSFAKTKTLVNCQANISMPDLPAGGAVMNIRVVQKNGEFGAYTSTTQDGTVSPTQYVNVDGMKGDVREGLTGSELESDNAGLSEVERFISHALMTTRDEELKDYFSAGFDLTKVRDATVYLIDPRPEDNIGAAAVIQARDAGGKLLGSFLGGLFVRPCKGEAAKVSPSTPRPHEIMGFQKVESNPNFVKFSFAEEGTFLVSAPKFSSRDEAIKFCQSQAGYELTSSTLPGIMVFSGFDFDELKSNIVDDTVLTNKGTLGGELRSGIVFFTKDQTIGSNGVYEMRNGCGDLCEAVEPIADINARLAKIGKPALAIPAVCIDGKLNGFLAQ